jgi:carbamoyltransferase
MAVVLGLSFFYHDSAAALCRDGEIVAAVAEERLCRRKHTSEFPKLSVEFCLEQAGLRSINDLDAMVFYEKPLTKLLRIIETSVATWPLSASRFVTRLPFYLKSKVDIRRVIRQHYPNYEGYVLFNEHHLSHAAAAFYPSPFSEAAIMTLDGVGEWETTAIGFGEDRKIRLDQSLRFPHSIGLLYSALTAYLGFQVNDGEWKVMGLAPYGEPRYTDAFRKLVHWGDDGSFALDMRYFAHHWSNRRAYHERRWRELFGFPPRDPGEAIEQHHEDLARSGQAVAEELILGIARHAREKYGSANLVIAGGVGLNSVANWAIEREGVFDQVWIQPAAGDDGGALGAALYVSHQLEGEPRQRLESAALGPGFDDRIVEEFLASRDIPFERLDRSALVRRAADAIAAGQVVGWFQGRMEFGPRALGGRSILADATNPEMKEIINGKIKFREYFRPFAPMVPLDRVHEFFDVAPGTELPFMLKIPDVRADAAEKLPAITHEDGTGRVQTVDRDRDPLLHELLEAVGERTGVPVLVNTSFNVRGEPIVCTPYDAWRCFCETGIDALFLGSFVVDEKPDESIDIEARYARSDHLEAQLDRSDEEARDVVAEVHDAIDRTVIDTHDPARVLEFYRSLPFNFFSNATDASLAIMRRNQIRTYPDLHRVLAAGSGAEVLDVGCGAGWFSNSCAHYYENRVTGFDFNAVALDQARGVARLMKRAEEIDLFVADVFEVDLEPRFDVVNSIGVLHHTEDCHKAIRRAARWLRPGGHLHLGLYHDQGRRPFLDHFRGMQERGASVEEMFEAFAQLEFPAEDRVHLYSWFRDQVLHPHETQHGYAEIAALLEEEGLTVLSSSLCGFKPVPSADEMRERERSFGNLGERRLRERRYFPGFFTLLATTRDGAQ